MSPGTQRLLRERLSTLRRRLENEEQAFRQAEQETAAIREERDASAAEITDLEGFLRADGLEP